MSTRLRAKSHHLPEIALQEMPKNAASSLHVLSVAVA